MSVELSIKDHVATVTLARPDALNAIDLDTEAQLQHIWTQLENDREVRVIVLTGSGDRAFCVGADFPSPRPCSPWHLKHSSFLNTSRPSAIVAAEEDGALATVIGFGAAALKKSESDLM